MICLIALVVFGILGIFSASHRAIAIEAFDCVFRRMTLRKCNTGFDKKMKSKIMGKLLRKSPRTAKAVYKHFEAISWFFTILMIASFAYSAVSVYNWAAYGNCNGENSNAFCVFNAFGDKATITLSDIPLDDFPSFGPVDAKVQIVEFGCYQCPYTLLAEKEMKKIRSTYLNDVHITFIPAPTPHHYHAVHAAEAAECAGFEGKYWQYHKILFDNQEKFNNSLSSDKVLTVFEDLGKSIGLGNTFDTCLAKGIAANKIQKASEYSLNIGIKGTPTFYVNGVKTKKALTLADVEKLLNSK